MPCFLPARQEINPLYTKIVYNFRKYFINQLASLYDIYDIHLRYYIHFFTMVSFFPILPQDFHVRLCLIMSFNSEFISFKKIIYY